MNIYVLIAIEFFLNFLGAAFLGTWTKVDKLAYHWFDCAYPSWLYEETEMNKLGCCLLSILIISIFPVFGIVSSLYWITHVGRGR